MIKDLLRDGTSFAVIVSNPKFIADRNYGSREYFVILKEEDLPKQLSPTTVEDGIVQIDMTEDETDYFKKVSEELFQRVLHTDDGRVYEIKNNPFKQYIQNN